MSARQIIIAAAALMASIAAERSLLGGQHGDGWWAQIPGFFALFGFFVCLLIVVSAKGLGSYWLQRQEGYYDREAGDD